jgi:hypothetical protein
MSASPDEDGKILVRVFKPGISFSQSRRKEGRKSEHYQTEGKQAALQDIVVRCQTTPGSAENIMTESELEGRRPAGV